MLIIDVVYCGHIVNVCFVIIMCIVNCCWHWFLNQLSIFYRNNGRLIFGLYESLFGDFLNPDHGNHIDNKFTKVYRTHDKLIVMWVTIPALTFLL